MSTMGKGATVSEARPLETRPLETRVSVMEGRMEGIERDIHTVAKLVHSINDKIGSQPRQIPFREILVSVGSTLAIIAYLFSFTASWIHADQAPTIQRISGIERTLEKLLETNYVLVPKNTRTQ